MGNAMPMNAVNKFISGAGVSPYTPWTATRRQPVLGGAGAAPFYTW